MQESFMRVGFKNHSSLSSAYSRFLLTQYQQTAAQRQFKRRKRYESLGEGEGTTIWISHEMVGGVVDQRWKVKINKALDHHAIQLLQRQLRVIAQASDYLSTTERGTIVKMPKQGPETKVRWKQRVLTLYAKSVFSSTGWVRRTAVPKEAMLMYDLGAQEIEMILKNRLDENQVFTEFTQQVPVRVLLRVMESLDEHGKDDTNSAEHHEESSEATFTSFLSRRREKLRSEQSMMEESFYMMVPMK